MYLGGIIINVPQTDGQRQLRVSRGEMLFVLKLETPYIMARNV